MRLDDNKKCRILPPLSFNVMCIKVGDKHGHWAVRNSLRSWICKGSVFVLNQSDVLKFWVLLSPDSARFISHSSPIPSEWTVVLGRLRQNGSNPFEVTLNVTNITLSNLTGSNVAVLLLATQPTLSDYIQPICLDNGRNFTVGSTCWAAGWSSGRGGGESIISPL